MMENINLHEVVSVAMNTELCCNTHDIGSYNTVLFVQLEGWMDSFSKNKKCISCQEKAKEIFIFLKEKE